MRTARPSCRPPITKSANTMVSGFGQRATSAKEAATRPQSASRERHEYRSSSSRRSSTSSRRSARRNDLSEPSVGALVADPITTLLPPRASQRPPSSGDPGDRASGGRHVDRETLPTRRGQSGRNGASRRAEPCDLPKGRSPREGGGPGRVVGSPNRPTGRTRPSLLAGGGTIAAPCCVPGRDRPPGSPPRVHGGPRALVPCAPCRDRGLATKPRERRARGRGPL